MFFLLLVIFCVKLDVQCDVERQRILDLDAELMADEQKYTELQAEIEQYQERNQAAISEMVQAIFVYGDD